MPQPARALAGAACALVLSTTMFTPAAFADDAKGDDATTSRNAISAAADSIRGELGPALSTYDQAKKTLEALEATDIATARVQGLQDMMYDGTEKHPTVTLRIGSVKDGKKTDVTSRGRRFQRAIRWRPGQSRHRARNHHRRRRLHGHRGNEFRDSSGRLGERNHRHDSRPCTHKLPH